MIYNLITLFIQYLWCLKNWTKLVLTPNEKVCWLTIPEIKLLFQCPFYLYFKIVVILVLLLPIILNSKLIVKLQGESSTNLKEFNGILRKTVNIINFTIKWLKSVWGEKSALSLCLIKIKYIFYQSFHLETVHFHLLCLSLVAGGKQSCSYTLSRQLIIWSYEFSD